MKKPSSRFQSGFSLVELMIGIALGLIVIAGLVTLLSNTSRTRTELAKTSQQIENGRYAIQLISLDLHHAGFFGDLYSPSLNAAYAAPDPCASTSWTAVDALQYPVQGVAASSFWSGCKLSVDKKDGAGNPVLDAQGDPVQVPTIVPLENTEALVIRRADRMAVCSNGAIVDNEYYIQASPDSALIQQGNSAGFNFLTKSPAGNNATLCKITSSDATRLDPACGVHLNPNAAGTACPTRVSATIRKLHVIVYFVGLFNGSPTLQRLVLGPSGMAVEPLVEGIEMLRIEYGVDTTTNTADASFGIPDEYKAVGSMTNANWQNVVSVRVSILARNPQPTPGYSDDKTYTVGGYSSTPANRTAAENQFKRHVFTSTVSLTNPAGRRVLPL